MNGLNNYELGEEIFSDENVFSWVKQFLELIEIGNTVENRRLTCLRLMVSLIQDELLFKSHHHIRYVLYSYTLDGKIKKLSVSVTLENFTVNSGGESVIFLYSKKINRKPPQSGCCYLQLSVNVTG